MPAAPKGIDLDQAYGIGRQVAVRPEAFGALLYHFGTRRLSFLKDRRLLAVVQQLPSAASAREACLSAGLAEHELPTYGRALATLLATNMVEVRA